MITIVNTTEKRNYDNDRKIPQEREITITIVNTPGKRDYDNDRTCPKRRKPKERERKKERITSFLKTFVNPKKEKDCTLRETLYFEKHRTLRNFEIVVT